MSIELKQAAQQAAEAIAWMLNVIRRDAPQISGKAMGNAEKCATDLRAAIQQAEAKTDEPVAWMWKFEGENGAAFSRKKPTISIRYGVNYVPLYTHPAPGVPEFSRIAKRKLDELQEQGFAITGYAIQRGPVRGFIDGVGFVGWWQGEPDPGVPDGWRIEEKGGTHMRRLDYQGNFTGPDAALIAAARDLLAAAIKVNALSIQSDAHKELRAAIAKALDHEA